MGGEIDGLRSHLSRGEAAAEMGHPTVVQVRGAQSFVGTLASVWRRPSLTALEVAWRWVYGVPALALTGWQVRKVLLVATGGSLDPARLGLDRALLNDPVGALSADPLAAAGRFAEAVRLVWPGLERVGAWVVPVLVVGWVVASAVGRTLVLRRADGRLHSRVGTVMGLQAVRVAALALVFGLWLAVVRWSSAVSVGGPVAAGREPNLVGWFAMVIVATLGIFTGWGFVSWVFTAAPLLAMMEGLGAGGGLKAALRLGPVQGKLVEVNLVLAVVKIALIVLAMVFSATPLPFESVTTPEFLGWWWAGVAVAYLLWSDFFHVARLVGYLELWGSRRGKTRAERPCGAGSWRPMM